MNVLASILLSICSFGVMASNHTARVIKLENTSEVYVPGENKESTYKHVKYLDEVYHIIPAVRGMKLENGYILSTGPQSKAKIIFNNGDHLFISENTQYKINWKGFDQNHQEDRSTIYLIRGALRGLIQKDGPRSGMKVKTASTVMGVRGTDFYVSEKHGDMNVSVLRGEVEVVASESNLNAIKVKTGETLNTENKKATVMAISKEDFQEIIKTASVQIPSKTEMSKEFIELEKKASAMTLNDIKEYQPQIYKEILAQKNSSDLTSDSLAINTIKIMEEKAPSRSKKPSESDLDSENDPYDQYKFKKEK